jgi:hypothetical protein
VKLIIRSWESQSPKKGTPGEYILFALGDITIDDDQKTATATIGQRSDTGRLYQRTPSDRSLYYHKFTIDMAQASIQIPALLTLVDRMNSGDEPMSGRFTSTAKDWARVFEAIGYTPEIEATLDEMASIEPPDETLQQIAGLVSDLADKVADAESKPMPDQFPLNLPIYSSFQTRRGLSPNGQGDRAELLVDADRVFTFTFFAGDSSRSVRYAENDAIGLLNVYGDIWEPTRE